MNIHIFDVDHTLIRQSTGRCFIREAIKYGLISITQLIKFPIKFLLYKLALLDPEVIENEIRTLKDIEFDFLKKIALESFNRKMKSQIYIDAIKLVNELKNEGHRVIAATSSVDFLIGPVLDYLGIEEFISTQMEVIDGKTTGKLIGNAAFGVGKKEAVEHFFNKENLSFDDAVFYSDSINDLPLLNICKKAVPVNPDKLLYKESLKRGWDCLKFKDIVGNN